jgi:HSP20 family protein
MVYRTTVSAPIFGLRREIDRLFEDTFGREGLSASGWVPAVDVREDNQEVTLTFELPGVSPLDVEITTDNGVLTVHGRKEQTRKEGDENSRYHVIERAYGEFSRSFQLPKGLDESKIEADYKNGLLVVRIPKAALPQPKRIQIKAESEPGNGSGQQNAQESAKQPKVKSAAGSAA